MTRLIAFRSTLRASFRASQRSWSGVFANLLLLTLSLPALYPLRGAGLFASHDGLHHLYRLFEVDRALRAGTLFSRWMPDLGFGYGFPVLNYYAPLAYYLALPFTALGAGAISATKLLYALGFLSAAYGAYRLSRPFLGGAGAILTAGAYTYLPYHMADAYVRGALPEFLALAELPFLLWMLTRAIRTGSGAAAATYAITAVALAITHNLSVVLAAPLVLLFAISMSWVNGKWRSLWGIAAATLVGMMIAAFYWLPAIGELGAIRASLTGSRSDALVAQLAPLSHLLSPSIIYGYVPYDDPNLILHPLGLASVILALASIPVVLVQWRRLERHQRAWIGSCWVACAGGIFMMLPASATLWRMVPGLTYLQFPWRWHAAVAVAMAGMIGSLLIVPGGMSAPRTRRLAGLRPAAAVALTLALAVTTLGGLSDEKQTLPGREEMLTESDVSLEGMAAYEYNLFLAARLWESGDQGWLFEYMPVWVQEKPKELILPPAQPPSASQETDPPLGRVTITAWGLSTTNLTMDAPQATCFRMHTFYFPGWKASVDDRWVATYPSSPLGLVTVDIPAGLHHVSLYFGYTSMRILGLVISVAGLAIGAAWLALTRRARYLAIVGTTAIVLSSLWLWHSYSRPLAAPHPTWANFANAFALVGYDIAPPEAPGGALTVDLWWLGLKQPTQDFKAFVHLEDDDGRMTAQHDSQPGMNFSPTTRWAPNELVRDHHTVILPHELEAGQYVLSVGLYHPDTMENLDLLDEAGNPRDWQLVLGTLTWDEMTINVQPP